MALVLLPVLLFAFGMPLKPKDSWPRWAFECALLCGRFTVAWPSSEDRLRETAKLRDPVDRSESSEGYCARLKGGMLCDGAPADMLEMLGSTVEAGRRNHGVAVNHKKGRYCVLAPRLWVM